MILHTLEILCSATKNITVLNFSNITILNEMWHNNYNKKVMINFVLYSVLGARCDNRRQLTADHSIFYCSSVENPQK
jgi:hypothetical protein